jgi:hypothetical protein
MSREGDIIFDTTQALQTPSLLAIMNTFTLPHVPILTHKELGNLISIKKNALQISKIKLELVDKYFQPVMLLSPMTIFIKITQKYDVIRIKHSKREKKQFKKVYGSKPERPKKLSRFLTQLRERLHEDSS